jgi:hypothetical protein
MNASFRARMMRNALQREQRTLQDAGNIGAADAIVDYLNTADDASLNRLADIIAPVARPLGEVLGATENVGSCSDDRGSTFDHNGNLRD